MRLTIQTTRRLLLAVLAFLLLTIVSNYLPVKALLRATAPNDTTSPVLPLISPSAPSSIQRSFPPSTPLFFLSNTHLNTLKTLLNTRYAVLTPNIKSTPSTMVKPAENVTLANKTISVIPIPSKDKFAHAASNQNGFIKHLILVGQTDDAWQTISHHDQLTHPLFEQLMPLKKYLQIPVKQLEVLYSDYWYNGKISLKNSKILAVRIKRTHADDSFYFSREVNGRTLYYDEHGQSLEFAMDRTPFTQVKVNSPFSRARRHPQTGYVRPHEGVDLDARYGTPVGSTGDGTVVFAGTQKGYGRIVIINHNNGYQTRYAHLSAIRIKNGDTVKRGQIIGNVGNSGLSSGPHLHYEVRIDGVAKNPMTVALPGYDPLPPSSLNTWRYYAARYISTMNVLEQGIYK